MAGEEAERRSETFRLSERAQGTNASDIRVLRGQHEFLIKIPDDFVEFIVQARRCVQRYIASYYSTTVSVLAGGQRYAPEGSNVDEFDAKLRVRAGGSRNTYAAKSSR